MYSPKHSTLVALLLFSDATEFYWVPLITSLRALFSDYVNSSNLVFGSQFHCTHQSFTNVGQDILIHSQVVFIASFEEFAQVNNCNRQTQRIECVAKPSRLCWKQSRLKLRREELFICLVIY